MNITLTVKGQVAFINEQEQKGTRVFEGKRAESNLSDLSNFMLRLEDRKVEILGASVQVANEYITVNTSREVNAIRQAIHGLLWGLANAI